MDNNEAEHTYTDRRVRQWESHTNTIISAVGLGLLFWVGTSVVDLNKEVSTLSVRIEQIADIKVQIINLTNKVEKNMEGDSEIRERVALLEHVMYREGIAE